ncbi:MAG: hypothetical protein AAB877_03040 [Patescibacteria group bacterium]
MKFPKIKNNYFLIFVLVLAFVLVVTCFYRQNLENFLGPNKGDIDLGTSYVPAESYSFFGNNGEILIIHSNGKIEWKGEQSKIALNFWKAISEVWPEFLEKECGKKRF